MTLNNYSIRHELGEIRREIKELKRELTRYRGFIGGVVWVVGALSAAIGLLIGHKGG